MDMVCDATNARWLDAVLFRDPAQIRPKTFPDLRAKDWNALFWTKDAVDVQRIKWVRHKNILSHESGN
jgi:hypothetical protein